MVSNEKSECGAAQRDFLLREVLRFMKRASDSGDRNRTARSSATAPSLTFH